MPSITLGSEACASVSKRHVWLPHDDCDAAWQQGQRQSVTSEEIEVSGGLVERLGVAVAHPVGQRLLHVGKFDEAESR